MSDTNQAEVPKQEVEQKPVEQPKQEEKKERTPEEQKAYEEREKKIQESLQSFWYPMEDGEQNECIDKLRKNVKRKSASTIAVDVAVYSIIAALVALIIRVGYGIIKL